MKQSKSMSHKILGKQAELSQEMAVAHFSSVGRLALHVSAQ